jgi:neutral ceramidase
VRIRRVTSIAAVALCAAIAPTAAQAKAGDALEAGVGRADITPPTGYALGGWTRADRIGTGVQTRLQASAMVIRSGHRKLALVSVDLFAAPGGLVADAARRAGHGFSQKNVLVGATHTHSGPSQFANFATLNTLAPSPQTITDPTSFVNFLKPEQADPQIYTFLVKRIATALKRANRDLGPATAGWGTTQLLGVTENRSLEAHLADHGIIEPYGTGSVSQDPLGYKDTIDPLVSVLRVDRVNADDSLTPIGAWSTFADHGTVNPSDYQVYTEDHQGTATRTFEAKMRKAGDVPKRDPVIDVFPNSNEGDQSAGLNGQGPLIAERVGTREGRAMFKAWKRAGKHLSAAPPVDLLWTRVCFCGQATSDGTVADEPQAGAPFLTGSEEGRGPLYDITGQPLEGDTSPTENTPHQGDKVGIAFATTKDSYPNAVPLFLLRIGKRIIITFPGEATVEVGRRARARVLEIAHSLGVNGVTVMGLTNEFIQYITTPEEYSRQHYEGGSTIYGPAEGAAMTDVLVQMAKDLRDGKRAPKPYPFDPRHGVTPTGAPFGKGASTATATTQPVAVPPGAQAVFKWQGGPRGLDRPLDRRFIAIQRKDKKPAASTAAGLRAGLRPPRSHRWTRVADDLGVSIVWTGDPDGAYDAHWQVPHKAKAGTYRVVVTANLYKLRSATFAVDPSAPATDTDPTHPAAMFGPVTRH